MNRKTVIKKVSVLALALSMTVTSPGVQMVMPLMAQEETVTKTDVQIQNLIITPRIKKIELTFDLPQGAPADLAYNIYRGTKMDELSLAGTATVNTETGKATYADTDAISDAIYFYQVRAEDADHVYVSDIQYNARAAGIDSVSSSLVYRDLSNETFDGSSAIALSTEEVNKLKDLENVVFLIKATPNANVNHTMVMMLGKPESAGAGNANRVFTQLTKEYKPQFIWAPEGKTAVNHTTTIQVPAQTPFLYAFGHVSGSSRVFLDINGTSEYFSNRDSFFNGVNGLDEITIGGWKADGAARANNGFDGTIDWIAFSDEFTTTDEVTSIITSKTQSDTTFRLDLNTDGGTLEASALSETSQKQKTVLTIPEASPTKEGYTFTGWSAVNGKTYKPGEKVILSKEAPALSLSAIYTRVGTVDPEPETLPQLVVQPGYKRVLLSLSSTSKAITSCDLLRAESENGTYSKIGTISSAGYIDTNVESGKTYFYKLKSGDLESETALSASTGTASYFEGSEIHKVLSESERTFNGSSTLDLSNQISKISSLNKGSVLIRFKSTANLGGNTSLLTYSNTADSDTDVTNSGKLLYWGLQNGRFRGNVKVTRAVNGSGFNDGYWHTAVYTSNPDEGNIYTIAVDGVEILNYDNTQFAGFLSNLANGDRLELGGYTGSGSSVLNGFSGTIDKVCISGEALSREEAQILSEEESVPPLREGMFSQRTGNTWLFAGGRETEGTFEDLAGVRNFAHQFEEYVRWEAPSSLKLGRNIEQIIYSRYVADGARSGRTLSDTLMALDRQITEISPKAISYMPGIEDLESRKNATDVNTWQESYRTSLQTLLEKASALSNGKGYLVLQTPHAYASQELNAQASAIKDLMQSFRNGLSEERQTHLVLVDHFAPTNTESFKSDCLNEDGILNAAGHYEIAKQLCDSIYGSSTFLYSRSSLNALTPIATPAYAAEYEENNLLQADFSGEKLNVTVKANEKSANWNVYVKNDDLTLSAPVTSGESMTLPITEGTWKVTLVSADQNMELPSLSITKGDAVGTAWANRLSSEKKTANQKKLDEILSSKDPLTWLFIGDSITHGAKHTMGYDAISESFTKYLHDPTGLNRAEDLVYNTAVSGALARDTLSEPHKSARITSFEPDVAIIMIGMNDCTNVTPAEFETQLRQNIENLKAKNPDVFIVLRACNTVAGRRYMNEMVNVVRDMAQEFDVILADHAQTWDDAVARLANARTQGAGNLNNDNLHPNGIGQNVMFDDLLKAMGIFDESNAYCRLEYKMNQTEKTSTTKPAPTVSVGTLRLDVASLLPSGQTAGTAEVSVTVGDVTWTKSYDKAKDESTVLTFTGLPAGQNAIVNAKVARYDAAEIITFAPSDPIEIPDDIQEVTVTLDSVSVSYSSPTLSLGNASSAEVSILRSDSQNGTYTNVGTTTNNTFTDTSAQAGKTYWYKAQWADRTIKVTEPKSITTGLQVFKDQSAVYVPLTGEIFDGTKLIDLSDQAAAVKALSSGTLFFRFRTTEKENMSIVYGKAAGTETDLYSVGGGTKDRISVGTKYFAGSDTLRLRNDFTHTRAEDPEDVRETNLADGQWHNVAIVCAPGSTRTFCWYVDGEMIFEFDGETNAGFFSKLTSMNQLTIGGYFNGESKDVNSGFKGAIRDVIFSDKVLTSDEGRKITTEPYSEEEPPKPVVLHKELLIEAINKAEGLEGSYSNKDAAFAQAIVDAQAVRDGAQNQDDIDTAARELNAKLLDLRLNPDKGQLEKLN